MINDEALVQTKSLSTQLSLTTNQEPRLPGDSRQHGQRGLQHGLHQLAGQPGEDGDGRGRPGGAPAALRLRRNEVEEPDADRPVERRHRDGHPKPRTSPACCGGAPGLPGQAGRGGSLAGPARAEEQVNMEALRDLADDFNVRDPRMLYRLARQRDLDVTQAMAFEALNTGAGKLAAEGPNDRLQADLIDFSQNTRGKTN